VTSQKCTFYEEDASCSHLCSSVLVAGSFYRRFRLDHPFRYLRLDGVEVEARASLHRWRFQEGLDFLAHYLRHEHEAPELELE